MINKSNIPNILSVTRIIFAPIFFYAFLNELYLISIIIFMVASITDVLDGYIARKINAISDLGSYLDVTSDFILVIMSFLAYVIKGWYDPLILILITIMFLLFIGTSSIKKPVYDPIGKYLGTYLMLMIFMSLILPEIVVIRILLIILVLFSLISIFSRLLFLQKSNLSL